MPKIEYNMDNCMKCLCPGCPVQKDSTCIKLKKPEWQKMQDAMREMTMTEEAEMHQMEETQGMNVRGGMAMPMQQEMEMEMLKPEEMIGLYCSSQVGMSTCSDLNPSAACTCPSCEVWIGNNLQSQHYCTEGDADERE